MTQITATLENGADDEKNIEEIVKEDLSPGKKEWLDKLNRFYNNVDREAIDLNDERTQYILSK